MMLEPGPRANTSLCLHQDMNYSFPERCIDSYYTSSCSGLTLWHLYRTITCLLSFSLTQKVSEFWRSSPSALKDQLCWLKKRRQKAQSGTAGHICQTLLWQSSSAERGIKPLPAFIFTLMFRFWCQNVQSQWCCIHCQDEFSRNLCYISERKQVNCFHAELFRRDQTDLCHLRKCFHRKHQICWFSNIKIYPCCCCYLMNISKATPLTGEEWCSNAMMQVPGKWLCLSLHHVLFPTWGSAGPGWAPPGRSGLSGVRAGCLLFVCHRLRSQMCQSINDWCLPSGPDSPLTCSRPRSCRPSTAIDAPFRN